MNFLRHAAGLILGMVFLLSISNEAKVWERTSAIEAKVIAWRRDIHQHPELADQENRTSHTGCQFTRLII